MKWSTKLNPRGTATLRAQYMSMNVLLLFARADYEVGNGLSYPFKEGKRMVTVQVLRSKNFSLCFPRGW